MIQEVLMRVQYVSDIHLDFMPGRSKELVRNARHFLEHCSGEPAEVLVIAGDTGEAETISPLLSAAAEMYENVVYVPGNHEYWGVKGYSAVKDIISEVITRHTNVHWLMDSHVTIGGQRFIGNTLWYADTPEARMGVRNFRDFYRMPCTKSDPWMFVAHAKTVRYLRNSIESGDIVVTHMAPSHISDQRPPDEFSCYYSTDLSGLILDTNPAIWIHGHIHTRSDYTIGETRVLAAPYGYHGYEANYLDNNARFRIASVVV